MSDHLYTGDSPPKEFDVATVVRPGGERVVVTLIDVLAEGVFLAEQSDEDGYPLREFIVFAKDVLPYQENH